MPELADLVERAQARGYTVELVRWCETADSPGIAGAGRGVIIYAKKVIRLRADQTIAELAEVLGHELDHAEAPYEGRRVDSEWYERNPRGRP